MSSGMSWPSDEIQLERRPKSRGERFRDIFKILLGFVDEALILVVLAYFIYRFVF